MTSALLKDLLKPSTLFSIFGSTGLVIVVGKILQIILHAVLARMIGPTDFGALNFAVGSAQIISTAILFGLPISATRLTSQYAVTESPEEWNGFLTLLLFYGCAVCIATSIFFCIVAPLISTPNYDTTFLLTAAFIPAWVLMLLRCAVMRGLGFITAALLPWEIGTPFVTFLFLWFICPDADLWMVGLSYAAVALTSEILGLWWLARKIPVSVRQASRRFPMKKWIQVSAPIYGFNLSQMIMNRADVVLIGAFLGLKEAGYYAIALRLAMAINILARVVNSVAAPLFAAAYQIRDHTSIERNARLMTAISIFAGIAGVTALALAGTWLIGLFGVTETRLVLYILLILASGEAITLACSPAVQALIMTSYEKSTMFLYIIGAILMLSGLPAAANFGLLFAAGWRSLVFGAVAIAAIFMAHRRLVRTPGN